MSTPRTVALCFTLAGLLIITSCKPQTATVKCSDLDRLDSGLGILNLPKLRNGMIIWLDSKNKKAERIVSVQLKDSDQSSGPKVDTTSLITKADFDVKVSADVPQTVQADLSAYVNSHTEYLLTQSVRKDINNPLGILNASAEAKSAAKAVPNADDVLLFVSTEVSGEHIKLSIQSQSGGTAQANVVKFGKFTFEISYDCANTVEQQSSANAPLLWKGQQIAFDRTSETFTFGNKLFNLKDYNFDITLQSQ